MCDYSLQGIRNRLAEEGETLVVHRFSTGSKGLTSPSYLRTAEMPKGWLDALKWLFAIQTQECAVCIPDGARLLLSGISSRLRQQHRLGPSEHVTFRQLSADAAVYRDAVEFASGARIRIQELEEGQSFEVVALSAEDRAVPEVLLEEEVSDQPDYRSWARRSPTTGG
jgi:hypothetical protein